MLLSYIGSGIYTVYISSRTTGQPAVYAKRVYNRYID